MKTLIKAARRCGVPLVSVTSYDQQGTIATLVGTINSSSPIITYDCVNGLKAAGEEGQEALSTIMGDTDPSLFTDPVTCLEAICKKAPERTVVILIGADRYLTDVRCQQAVINCRDPFKASERMIIMLSSTKLTLPADLQNDTLCIDDEVPDAEARGNIVKQLFKDADIKEPEESVIQTAIAATRGLSSYSAEQSVALSLTKEGLNTEDLWKRWRQAINGTPGLTVDTSGATLNDIGGLDNFKTFSRKIMNGRTPPSAVIRVEEIEKAFAGSGYGNGGLGDSSGTSQSVMQYLLTFMQEQNATGMIALGPAGGGKSLSSVAMGSAGNVPTITFDVGAIKGSLVGESEKNCRRALDTIKALAGERTFWIGTCNSLASLPPELRRRFKYGIWFFDLPDDKERDAIWKIWLKRYPDVKDVRPADEGWTGAEISTAVQTAYDLKCSPKEAAQWIVPVCKMASEVIEGLRKQASNRYLSANKPGVYQYAYNAPTTTTSRKMNLNAN
jgi:hypothetical protein